MAATLHDQGYANRDVPPREDAERTFLGGMRMTARSRLFLVLALLTLGALGAAGFLADERLSAAERQLADAVRVSELAARVEKRVWQARGAEREFLVGHDSQEVMEYDRIVASITESLNALNARPDANLLRDSITTLNEALAQHATEFRAVVEGARALGLGEAEGLGARLRAAADALEAKLAEVKATSLQGLFADMRRHEGAYLARGAAKDLAEVGRLDGEFAQLLGASPMARADRAQVTALIKGYQAALAAIGKAQAAIDRGTQRLNEIYAYMAPSVEGLVAFAANRVAVATRIEFETRALVRLAGAGAVGGAVLFLMTVGLILMRSMTGPARELARAARGLAMGAVGVSVPALGNRDEIGDIARTLVAAQNGLAEIAGLRKELDLSKSAVERGVAEAQRLRRELDLTKAGDPGSAAVAEATRLRSELAAAKAEVMRGEAEVARLRNDLTTRQAEWENDRADVPGLVGDLEALRGQVEQARGEIQRLRQDLGERERSLAENQQALAETRQSLAEMRARAPARPAAPAEEVPDLVRGTISSLTQELTASTQTVSAAAREAERTGTMIRGIMEAEEKIAGVEALLATIAEQTNFLIFRSGGREGRAEAGDKLVVLMGGDASGGDETVGERFDTIRRTTTEATRLVRDIDSAIESVKEVAIGIASATSAQALDVTNALLRQSEYLRGMLDNLVDGIQEGGDESASAAEPPRGQSTRRPPTRA